MMWKKSFGSKRNLTGLACSLEVGSVLHDAEEAQSRPNIVSAIKLHAPRQRMVTLKSPGWKREIKLGHPRQHCNLHAVQSVAHSIETISTGVAFCSYGYCRHHVGTMNGAISGILGALSVKGGRAPGHGMAERDAAGCPSKSVACPRAWVLNSVAKFVYCVQTVCKARFPVLEDLV